jgi:hypothetical protein
MSEESKYFLTEVQLHHIESNKWTAKPNGAYVDLYPEDFTGDAWNQICQQLEIPVESESATILYFGVKNETI